MSSIFSHLDVNQFVYFHEQLLDRPTNAETKAVVRRRRSSQMANDLEKSFNNDLLLAAPMLKEKKNDLKRLIVHYRHEKALRYFRREFHQLWEKTFSQTSAGDIQVIVGTLINRSLKSLLVRKCPPLSLLQCKEDNRDN